jgi:predicted metal-binding membrane protein
VGGLKTSRHSTDLPVAPARKVVVKQSGALLLMAIIAVIAWGVTAWTALDMGSAYAQLAMPMDHGWSLANAAAVLAMWSVMMAAMMLPSALPVLHLFGAMARKGGATDSRRLAFFGAGYLMVWLGFSVVATLAQWALQAAGTLEPMALASTSPWITAALLLLAGVVQFTKLKQACLTACRSPLGFLMGHWRDGSIGAGCMGMRHGLLCLGCCWALMLLLFAFGAMNLLWVVLLALMVAIEKLAPHGPLIGRALGVAMIGVAAVQLGLSA